MLSRGFDVPGINLVINFDAPYSKDRNGYPVAEKETYLHIIGWTGRFDTKGIAITLINEIECDNEL